MAAELEKLKKHESEVLEEARKKIAESSSSSSSESNGDSSSGSLLSIPAVSPKDLLQSEEDRRKKNVTSTKVQEEIEKLRQTLNQRKVLKEVPGEVEAAYVLHPPLWTLTRWGVAWLSEL